MASQIKLRSGLPIPIESCCSDTCAAFDCDAPHVEVIVRITDGIECTVTRAEDGCGYRVWCPACMNWAQPLNELGLLLDQIEVAFLHDDEKHRRAR